MHIHFLDPFQAGSSPVHRLDARVKFVLTLAFILTVALTPNGAWPVYLLLLACILSVEVLSGLGIAFVMKRSLLALPFVLAAIPVIFTLPGETLFKLEIGAITLTASQPGLERFISIALKSWISVQAAVVLSTTTRFPDLMVSMRSVGIPPLLVSTFGLMWRYLFVLADEAVRLMRARQARSSQSDHLDLKAGGSLAWRGKVAGGMAGSLFIRAFERSDRIYMAMLARGYDGEVRSAPQPPIRAGNLLFLAGCLLFLLLLLAAGYFFRG